jgi:hypothetical protein
VVVVTRDDTARLVPTSLVESGGGQSDIVLSCSAEELEGLEQIREFSYLHVGEPPSGDAEHDVGVEDLLSIPYYEAAELGGYAGAIDASVGLSYHRIPKGAVELRRSSPVWSSDGHRLGNVEGFTVDGDAITHVVLERGHLWGKRVTIPIAAFTSVETDSATVSLTKDEVGALPALRVHRA